MNLPRVSSIKSMTFTISITVINNCGVFAVFCIHNKYAILPRKIKHSRRITSSYYQSRLNPERDIHGTPHT